jgi:type IV fimbrial biogenesis protein FimT
MAIGKLQKEYRKIMHNLPERSSGYTLMELMVTIAIAGILLGVAIPSFTSIISSNRLTTYANELVTALNFARSEAIKRGLRITLCKSTNGDSCTTGDDWSQGWIIFTDHDNNAAYDSATETLLRVQANSANAITMVGNTNVANYISYIASGQSKLITGAFQAGTIKVCDNRTGNVGINIVINSVARIASHSNISCP